MEAVVFIVKQHINYRWWKYNYVTWAEMLSDKLLFKLYSSLSLTSSLSDSPPEVIATGEKNKMHHYLSKIAASSRSEHCWKPLWWCKQTTHQNTEERYSRL